MTLSRTSTVQPKSKLRVICSQLRKQMAQKPVKGKLA